MGVKFIRNKSQNDLKPIVAYYFVVMNCLTSLKNSISSWNEQDNKSVFLER